MKKYPQDHRELWQRFCQLEPKPRLYDGRVEKWGRFWTVVCALVWALAIGMYLYNQLIGGW